MNVNSWKNRLVDAWPHVIVWAVVIVTSAGRLLAATPSVARDSINVQELRHHITFLASDTLEGRAAGTRGGRAAATYLAHEFRKLGLTPAGDDEDFLQEFGQGYRNILALLPGSDPELRDEVILLGGHFDHVGYGNSTNSFGPFGQIHNGADDNASGTAAILEVAEALLRLDTPPRRSVLFALWDAEEAGMLGSEHWVRHPTFPLDRVKLAVNVDMVGRLRDDMVTVYGVRTSAGLRRTVAFANQHTGLTIDFDRTHRDDSDHWTFYQRRIPYLMLHTGDHPDYHRPSDDVEKLNYAGLERVTRMMFELTYLAADAEDVGRFRDDSRQEGDSEQVAANPPSRLGVAWRPRHDPGEPFHVTHVAAGSPAAQSGLRSGDRIVRFEGQSPAEIGDLRASVLVAEGSIRLQVERPGTTEPIDLTVTLRGEPVRLGVQWRTDPTDPLAVIVTGVVPGSPAAMAGIEKHDRLYPPPKWKASGADWLRLMTAASHDSITLNVDRSGRLQEVQLTLLPSPTT